MNKLLGVILVALGVAALWFGGIPYKSNETVLKLGPLEAKAELDKTAEIPKSFSAKDSRVRVLVQEKKEKANSRQSTCF